MVSTAGNINSSTRPVSNTAVPPARSDGHSPNRNISPLVSKTPIEQETEDKQGGLNLKQIGKYRIGKALGEGTFGTVRLGQHVETKQKVAIKILEKTKIAQMSDVGRVAREIKILKSISHPNIIKLYEVMDEP